MAPLGQVQPFTYAVTFTSLADGARATQTITLAADSDFMLHKLAFAPSTIVTWSAQIVDTGSGRALSNQLVAGNTLFGTAQQPFILPSPMVFAAGGAIQIDVQNNDGAARTFNLSLHGVKAFRPRA